MHYSPLQFFIFFKLSQIWPVRAPLGWVYVLWIWPQHFFRYSLFSATWRCSRFLWYFPCPRPESEWDGSLVHWMSSLMLVYNCFQALSGSGTKNACTIPWWYEYVVEQRNQWRRGNSLFSICSTNERRRNKECKISVWQTSWRSSLQAKIISGD